MTKKIEKSESVNSTDTVRETAVNPAPVRAVLLKKITSATIGATLGFKAKALTGLAYGVTGYISGVDVVTHAQFGAAFCFKGTFLAVAKAPDGGVKRFESAKLFLPDVIADVLADRFKTAVINSDGPAPRLEVKCIVRAVADPSVVVGYRFDVEMQGEPIEETETLFSSCIGMDIPAVALPAPSSALALTA